MRTKQNFTKFLRSKVSSLINLSGRSSWSTTIGPIKIPFMSALANMTGIYDGAMQEKLDKVL